MEDEILKAQDNAASAVAVAPRVTLKDIEDAIQDVYYFTAAEAVGEKAPESSPLDLLTICVLVMKNGFTVTGESACASPENFNPSLGREIAKRHAIEKCWGLMGFALRQSLHEATSRA